jgi:proteic killer suppression protein
VIESLGNALAEDLFDDKNSKATKALPRELRRVARRKLQYLHEAADLRDIKSPPGNRLEGLNADFKGLYSIRINDQWRVVFRSSSGNAYDVQVVDYHKWESEVWQSNRRTRFTPVKSCSKSFSSRWG